jgi:serine/threonine protein phosphatase PrpC
MVILRGYGSQMECILAQLSHGPLEMEVGLGAGGGCVGMPSYASYCAQVAAAVPCWCCPAAAERIGVFAEPEVESRALSEDCAFVVVASDGVFEFLSSQSVVDMVWL